MAKFIAKYNKTGSLMHRPGSGCPSKITPEMKAIVEAKMKEDNEAPAYQLYALLVLNQFRIDVRIVLRFRFAFGWTFRGSAYCQLIREGNKVKWPTVTYMMISIMLYEQMSVRCNWRCTNASAAENRVNPKTETKVF